MTMVSHSKALWRSWLARRPVTAEVAGSSPVRVASSAWHGRALRPGSSVGTSVRLKSGRSPVRSRPWPLNIVAVQRRESTRNSRYRGILRAQFIRPNLEGFRHDCSRKVSAGIDKGCVECRRDVVFWNSRRSAPARPWNLPRTRYSRIGITGCGMGTDRRARVSFDQLAADLSVRP